MVPIGIPQCMLTYGFFQHSKSLLQGSSSSSHPTPTLNFSSSWASLPCSFSFPYNYYFGYALYSMFLSWSPLSCSLPPSPPHDAIQSAGHNQCSASSLCSGLFLMLLAVVSLIATISTFSSGIPWGSYVLSLYIDGM